MLTFASLLLWSNSVYAEDPLPNLNVDGFAWAEQLVFDGLGSMFVSDAVLGELYRIQLCNNATSYCSEVYLTDGVKQFGGLAVTNDGTKLFAGVTMDDDSKAIVTTSTSNANGAYNILAKLDHQPNGLAFDEAHNQLFFTDERSHSVYAYSIDSGIVAVAYDDVDGADGCWFEPKASRLYVGELFTKMIHVFDVDANTGKVTHINEFVGMNKAYSKTHMLDDITLLNEDSSNLSLDNIALLGADFTGKQIVSFQLNGEEISKVPYPEGLSEIKEVTSVRWGKGPGFCPNSIYFTEGGGITKHSNNRRVLQVKMK
jgi:hypothetical protein